MWTETYDVPVNKRWARLRQLGLKWGMNGLNTIVQLIDEKIVVTCDADTLTELEYRLKNFDWYYAMSDDYRVWSNGEKSWNRIQALIAAAGEEGRALYERYKAANCSE